MASQNDMDQANQTFSGFMGFMKWGTIVSFAVAALVVIIIST